MSLRDFEVLHKLGEGAYSQVFKVKRISDSQTYALKKVRLAPLKDKEKLNALNEVRILASINHPNIIGYKEAFIDESTRTLCIVMEFADGGDLFTKIKNHVEKNTRFAETEIWSIIIQMVKGIKTLHDMGILHRDLKTANVFVCANGNVKIGDMNVSKVTSGQLVHTQTGTPYYASPEVWRDQPYDFKSDIWSLGCVIYETIMLNPPFRASDMKGLYTKVTRGIYPPILRSYSVDLGNLVRELLQVNPSFRPTCSDILELSSVIQRTKNNEKNFEDHNSLLGTIRMPRNFSNLAAVLPAAKYRHSSSVTSRERVISNLGPDSFDCARMVPSRDSSIKLPPLYKQKIVNKQALLQKVEVLRGRYKNV